MTVALPPLYCARFLDQLTQQQQLFSYRSFTGIRVGDDGKSTPMGDLLSNFGHKDFYVGANGTAGKRQREKNGLQYTASTTRLQQIQQQEKR